LYTPRTSSYKLYVGIIIFPPERWESEITPGPRIDYTITTTVGWGCTIYAVRLPVVCSLTGYGLGTALWLELHGVRRIAADGQVLFARWVARDRWFVLVVLAAGPAGSQRFSHVFGVQSTADLVTAEERALATFGRRSCKENRVLAVIV